MKRSILAALFAAAAAIAVPGFAQRGGHGGGFHGGGFHGGAFHGPGFARSAPFGGVAGFPAHRGFFPGHHHRSAVFIGAGFGFGVPAYYYYPGYYPAGYGVAYYPAYGAYPAYAVPVDPGPVMRLYCPDPAGYFPEVRDCNRDWVQVPQEEGGANP